MKKGELWLVDIPPTNGYEQSGLRPVLLMSSVEANTVIIVPLTTNLAALRYPHTVEMHPSASNGLKVTSIALVFQVRAIDKKRLQRKTGECDVEIMEEIDTMIKHLLSLS